MKIIRVSARCGSPCGTVNLAHLVDDIDLENGKYVLSLRDSISIDDVQKARSLLRRFTLGRAKASVKHSVGSVVNVAIESADVQDFVDLSDAVYMHLGVEHEHLPRPKHRLDDLSFIRGLRNDFRSLRDHIANRWRLFRESLI